MKMLLILALLLVCAQAIALDCKLLGEEVLGQKVLQELTKNPLQCNPNSVHLTFDDGPSTNVTPQILNSLQTRNVKASFFVTTTNLDVNHPKYKDHRALVLQTMKAGHLIANHGHNHDAYCLRMNKEGHILEKGFTEKERENQIKRSIDLLQWATEGKYNQQIPLLFRFPYGRGAMPSQLELEKMIASHEITLSKKTYSEQLTEYRKISPPLQSLAASNLSHLGWNHDSGDSSYPVKAPNEEVVKDYVLKNLRGLCSSTSATKVALFHDIKEMNIAAIPVIIDIGKCLGLKFISAQEMTKDKALKTAEVLIDKQDVLKGVVENTIDGLDSVKNLLINQCENETDKSCFSEQYKKRFAHCTGGDSICFEGKWLSSTDPIVLNNCH